MGAAAAASLTPDADPMNLENLQVGATGLTALGGACLGRVLPKLPSLTTLALYDNEAAGDSFCQSLAAVAAANTLNGNCIQSLSLDQTGISAVGLDALTKALPVLT